jgi:hypothetical protein
MIIDSPIISGSYTASGSLNQHGDVVITGSLTVTGTINGSITGSITTASYALNAETLDGLDSTSFTTTSSFNTVSGSFSTRVTNLESFSSSLDATFATDAQLTAVSQSFSSSLSTVSESLASRVANNEATGSSLTTASSSFSTRTTNLETASGSFSTRVTNNESNISSLQTASGSFSTRTTNLETASGSFSTRTTNLETASGSFSTRVTSAEGSVTSLNSKTGSYATTGSNTFVNTQYISAANNAISFTSTASLYTDGGLRVTKDMYVSGTSYFNNVTIFGTQSVQYITSSQLNIGTNIITVNTDTPTIRFGGLAVYDSGSTGLTGSMLWDSEDNQWIYSNPSGSTYDSAVFLVGPRNSGVLGNEVGISCNFLSKGNGLHHMTSSGIFEDGSRTCFYNNASITSAGAACFASSVTSLSNNFVATTNAYTTQGTVSYNDARGLILRAKTATVYDYAVYSAAENAMIVNPTGTNTISFLSGDVGIGTLSPTQLLHARKDQNAYTWARIDNQADSGSAYAGLQLGAYGNSWGLAIGSSLANSNSLNFLIDAGGTNVPKLTLFAAGIACFASTVCAPTLVVNNQTNISPDSSGVGQLMIQGNGYQGYTALDATAMYIGHNSQIRNLTFQTNETNRLTINGDGISCFACQICAPVSVVTGASIVSGCLGVGTGTPRTKAEFSSGLPTSIPTRTNTTNGIVITDGGDIYGRFGVSDFSAGGNGYPTYIQAGDWSGAVYYNLLLNPLGGNVGIGTTSPANKLDVNGTLSTSLIVPYGTTYKTSNFLDFYPGNDNVLFFHAGTSWGDPLIAVNGTTAGSILTNSLAQQLVIRGDGTNGIGFSNGSCINMIIKGSCVGIRTTSPRSTLHVQQATNDGVPAVGCARDGLIISSNNGNYGLNIGVDPTGPTWMQAMRFDDGATAYNLLLQPTGGCSLLIGTGTALAGCRQQLVIGGNNFGSLIALGNNGNGNKFVIESDSSENALINNKSATPMIFYTSGSRRFDITSDGIACFACQVCAPAAIFTGCVGIGQTSPSFGLEVFSSAQTAVTSNNTFGANFNIIFNRDNTGGTRNCFNLLADQNSAYIRTLNDFPINFVTNGQNRLLLSNTGIAVFACQVCTPYVSTNTIELGGTATSPTSACIGYGMFGYSGVGLGISAGATGPNQGIGFFVCGVERGRWISSGNLGVGTLCPGARLNVDGGDFRLNGTCVCSRFIVYQNYSNSAVGASLFNNSGTEVISLNGNAGNIGITGTMILNSRTVYATAAIYDNAANGNNVGIGFGPNSVLPIDGVGNPTNGTKDLGSSSYRWCTVYTSDLSLNNGIGNYTIVEGESDLFLYNNNSCKVFKFMLQEVCPEIAPAKRSI